MTRPLLVVLALALPACEKSEPGEPDDTDTGDAETSSTDGTEGNSATDGHSSTGAPPQNFCDGMELGASRPCQDTGVEYCHLDADGDLRWGLCNLDPKCTPGDSDPFCSVCELTHDGVPYWSDNGCTGPTSTPLALRFDDAPVRYAMSSATFDLGPECGATDWPGAATPWLALDRDRSGAIEAGDELFGSATRLRDGARADNGFTALAELDDNRDGRIDASDPDFARLVVWADHDADRRSTTWELTPVAAAGLVAVDLDYRRDRRCDARGNCEIERASFSFRDPLGRLRTGEVVDLHLACQ